ncbi:MAG: Gfo/Idh/MocA family oxidoreductase [Rhodospirillales bacterium]
MTPSVVIAGLGRIGCGYDLVKTGNGLPMTHVGAVMADSRFRLAGAADPDAERRQLCQSVWPDIHLAEDAGQLIDQARADIVCIATPSAIRRDLVEMAVRAGARLIFCEKPLALTVEDAEWITEHCAQRDVRIAVNLSRRWEPGCIAAGRMIARGDIGEVRRVTGLYTRGLSNNAAHLVDLVRSWIGDIQECSITGRHYPDAPDFRLMAGADIPVDVLGMDGTAVDLFRLEVFGSEGRILLDDFGAELSVRLAEPLTEDPTLRVLGTSRPIASDPGVTMSAAWDNLYDCLTKDSALACSGEDGLAVARICHRLEQMV